MKEHAMEFSQHCPKFYTYFCTLVSQNTFTWFHNKWESSLLNLFSILFVHSFSEHTEIRFNLLKVSHLNMKKQILETK